MGYSYDGINWYASPSTNNLFFQGLGIAGNSRVGPVVANSQVTMNSYTDINQLDIVADTYVNTGFTNMTVNINSNNISL